MKKYRKIKKSDKLPELPKDWKPLFLVKEDDWDYIFAIGKEKNYTIRWDRFSRNFTEMWEMAKDKNDLYYKQRQSLDPLNPKQITKGQKNN